jgi:hypothetical protein
LAGLDLEDLDAQQMGNLIYALIIEESTDMGDRPKARQELDGMLGGETISTVPERETWGLGPGAEDALEAMKMLGP